MFTVEPIQLLHIRTVTAVNLPLLPVTAALLVADHEFPPPVLELALRQTYHTYPVSLYFAVDCPYGILHAPALAHVLTASHSLRHYLAFPSSLSPAM